MSRPKGKWELLKTYEGFEIYVNPDSGQFGVQLGKDAWLARKDLKAVEREIRKRVGGIPVIMTSDYRVFRTQVTGLEKGAWLTADGNSYGTYRYRIYPDDAELLARIEALREERAELLAQARGVEDLWFATLKEYQRISETALGGLLAAAREAEPDDGEARDAGV